MKLKLILTLSIVTLMVGCQPSLGRRPAATPLPGWRSLVSGLLLEDDAFPEGWTRIRDHPVGSLTDPTINAVYRSWWWEANGSGKVEQSINRAYTSADAADYYAELRQGQFFELRTPPPPDFYVPYEPPEAINFQSQTADEIYFACGFRISGHCRVLARYRNYVVELRLERESDYDGHITHGLTYAEIEGVVSAMDARFAEAVK